MYWKKRREEGTWRPMKKKWTHEGPCKNKEISHAQKYKKGETKSWNNLSFLLSTSSTTYPHTCTSRSWLYDLLTLWVRSLTLQNIWDKYALVFLPTLSSTKKPLEVGERRHTKGLGEDTNTFERMRVSFEELVFLFRKLLKTSGHNLKQGMGKWCSMKRSISQPPKTRRRPKAPWKLR